MKSNLTILFFIFFSIVSYSQPNSNAQLASYYFTNGEFDKALIYYEKIYQEEPTKINFHKYYECLIATENYKEAEKLIKSGEKNYGYEVSYQFLIADFYDKSKNPEKREKQFEKIIDEIQPSEQMVQDVFQNFLSINELDKAFESLNKGKKVLKNQIKFQLDFAKYYQTIGDEEKMLDAYFDYIEENSYNVGIVQTRLSNAYDLTDNSTEFYSKLKTRLLLNIQKHPDNFVYNQLLIWLFLQSQNYNGALIQVIALDNRIKDSDGSQIFQLGLDCIEAKAYNVAMKAFSELIIKGKDHSLFIPANYQYLNASFKQITENKIFNKEELATLINRYNEVIDMYTNPQTTLQLNLQKATILAYYMDESEKASELLNQLIQNPRIRDIDRAVCKMKLADINVLSGDIWEASLLYMQIDTDFKYEEIGQEAKLKNARVYYYEGEYEYAQSQLDVLKQSTSKLIANDAMELSILITENLGLDSNYRAMNWFSKAELAIAKHQYNEATIFLDSIQKEFPFHDLADEVLFKKAEIEKEQGNWLNAISYLEKLVQNYPQDILADNALFEIASIYHHQLNQVEKAKEFYKKILFEYKGSIFSEETRKRYRILRGDLVEEQP